MENKPSQQKPAENTEVNQDELILQQQRRIEKEISESIALVGEKEPLQSLEREYLEDEVYLSKAKTLGQKYSYIRRTRPDGNCFFRAFSYAYLERLIDIKDEFEKFRELALKSKDNLVSLGFPEFTVEDFHDTFMEVIDKVGAGTEASRLELHKLFNEQGYSDYVVVYLRLIASGQLQREADFYQHFIEGDRTVTEFCHQEVEPMYKESDHIHIIAMSAALGTGVQVRYMDRGAGTEATAHDFPEGVPPAVHLLYRPGHYDILYP
ncbi:ubiquitin thioesterase otubain-like [Neodiprion pinetum]|uniref:ubiquitinyl hydrolase 1 n=1 Tax=Neodiprion lecontei TaxID=441921 RepID=A0A6J0C0W8_NEOLC|nr:ubiquitin thioesterase otubain-like [Neodiprion lecontei]XP_046415803.1 ubiquitin thioesterase otubain-like [Neodiprion fabricii]XP_046472687.1 ubiquitin thioesterase otubain-like [Neodiprion pinetum]XP_046610457.1 ubiquitin thioesterase otubain-like [Neodiprion virginianus]